MPSMIREREGGTLLKCVELFGACGADWFDGLVVDFPKMELWLFDWLCFCI